MQKKGVIAIVIVAVVVVAAIGLTIASTINQDQKEQKAETYYYIDGNGGTSGGKNVVEWTSTSLPGNDLFTKENYNYAVFSTKADGTGTMYWTNDACAEPKGSTLYAIWNPNYVNISGIIEDDLFSSKYMSLLFECGNESKHAPHSDSYDVKFDGTSVGTPGVFGKSVTITIAESSDGTVIVDGNKVTVTCDDATYTFEIKSGATMEKVDSAGQNKGVKLTDYSELSNSCYFVKLNITITTD